MKQTERKPDKTLADKQKEQAGATGTFGQKNITNYMPIIVFALERTASYFSKNLKSQIHTMISKIN